MEWYKLSNEQIADSPSLLIYKERVVRNIELMKQIAGSAERLFVHVKTNKMVEVVELMLHSGIKNFKCATIAEAELVGIAIQKSELSSNFQVIIAHQLVGPKIERLIQLVQKFPQINFSSLVDCENMALLTNEIFKKHNLVANVYLDINNGMDRSGHELNSVILGFYESLLKASNLNCLGLHVYDGHLREPNFEKRKKEIDSDFSNVQALIAEIVKRNLKKPTVVAGGTPAFTSHALRSETLCSPGTCVLWDWGYGDKFEEQHFEYAALVLTRIISKPKKGLITVDMGHKAVAAENPIDKRIRFLNLGNYELLSQSEEHGVVKVENWEELKVGDVLYGVPYHVCPTVNLYDEAYWVENQEIKGVWQVLGRKRKISI